MHGSNLTVSTPAGNPSLCTPDVKGTDQVDTAFCHGIGSLPLSLKCLSHIPDETLDKILAAQDALRWTNLGLASEDAVTSSYHYPSTFQHFVVQFIKL